MNFFCMVDGCTSQQTWWVDALDRSQNPPTIILAGYCDEHVSMRDEFATIPPDAWPHNQTSGRMCHRAENESSGGTDPPTGRNAT